MEEQGNHTPKAPTREGPPSRHAPNPPKTPGRAPAPTRQTPTGRTASGRPVPPHRTYDTQRGASAGLIPVLSLVIILLLTLTAAVMVVRSKADDPSPSIQTTTAPSESTSPVETTEQTQTTTSPPQTDPPETLSPMPFDGFAFPEGMSSRYALLIHRESGKIVCEKDADHVAPPASLTKIMTVLVALDHLTDPDTAYTVSQDLLDRLEEANASQAGFKANETIKVKDLMYAALLPSGADGSVGLAELVSGSEEAFAQLMNEKAAQIGMTNTHFVNATGLHAEGHVSTARDMALLLETALQNETFAEIFTSEWHVSEKTPQHESGLWMRSTMFKALEAEDIERSYFVGGKTGYTEEAGLCLASVTKWDGEEYLLVTMGAGNGENRPRYHVLDAVLIYDALYTYLREKN